MRNKHVKNKIAALLLICPLCVSAFTACGKNRPEVATMPQHSVRDAYEEVPDAEDVSADYSLDDMQYDTQEDTLPFDYKNDVMSDETMEEILSGEGAVTAFIGAPFYDGIIRDENDALEALYSAVYRIGGDDTTEFECQVIQPTEDGTTYYVFQQIAGDMVVYGASVKLITDGTGHAVGLVSAIVPGIQASSMDSWAIDDIGAEQVVLDHYRGEKLKTVPGATEAVLLPIEDGREQYFYVWAVYTDNIFEDADMAYTVHYVDQEGTFLYSTPVSQPGSAAARSGGAAAFAFEGMEQAVWSGTVTAYDGHTEDVEIPVMIDPETEAVILGDAGRQILCADYADFFYEDTLSPCVATEDRFDDEAVLTYINYIEIYDLYGTTGWDGPDGDGTPSLLLMNAVDENGEPEFNACYTGRIQGFQVFEFDTTQPFGEAMDVVGHEFTHCFTGTSMTTNIYLNDYGAINEGMSDVLGNLAAMMTDETDEPFVMGEKTGGIVRRVMGNPNEEMQPAFMWDRYYLPEAAEGSEYNDNGGVHTNSSLLNILSYKLHEAGMPVEDEFYYWMNVSHAMTPRTDYGQMAELLPWVMDRIGESEYTQVLKDAIAATGITDRDIPSTPAPGLGIIRVTFPEEQILSDYYVTATFYYLDSDEAFETFPALTTDEIAAALPAGRYYMSINIIEPQTEETLYAVPIGSGWEVMDEEEFMEYIPGIDEEDLLVIEAGDVLSLDERSLLQALTEFDISRYNP